MRSFIIDSRWLSKHIYLYYLTLNLIFGHAKDTLATRTANSLDGQFSTVGKYSDVLPHLHEAINNDKNYASAECAKVVETNPEAKKASHVINDMNDEYMLNPCKAKIWFVIELCETIQATHMKIANYELFSSTPKDFTVFFSDVYPADDWKLVGRFTATDSRTLQRFDLNKVGFGKFIKVEMHSHYGNEHYCPISEVKVYGESMVDEYEKTQKIDEENQSKPSVAIKVQKSRQNSAFRVYRTMMVEPNTCGLIESYDKVDPGRLIKGSRKPADKTSNLAQQPTQAPGGNRSMTPLKPSVFTELSNKVKALEISMKSQIETTEKKTEAKFDKLNREFRSLALIVIAYYVYKVMLDLM